MKKLTSLTLLFAVALSSTGFCADSPGGYATPAQAKAQRKANQQRADLEAKIKAQMIRSGQLASGGYTTAEQEKEIKNKADKMSGFAERAQTSRGEGLLGRMFGGIKEAAAAKPAEKPAKKTAAKLTKKPAKKTATKPIEKTTWWNRIIQTTKAHPIWWKSGASLLGVTAIVAGVTGGMARHYNDIPDDKLNKKIKNRFVRMLVKIGRKGGVKYQPRAAAAA